MGGAHVGRGPKLRTAAEAPVGGGDAPLEWCLPPRAHTSRRTGRRAYLAADLARRSCRSTCSPVLDLGRSRRLHHSRFAAGLRRGASPDAFQRNYLATGAAAVGGGGAARTAPNSSKQLPRGAAHRALAKRWSLPIYYQLRAKHITEALDAALHAAARAHRRRRRRRRARGGGGARESREAAPAVRTAAAAAAAAASALRSLAQRLPRCTVAAADQAGGGAGRFAAGWRRSQPGGRRPLGASGADLYFATRVAAWVAARAARLGAGAVVEAAAAEGGGGGAGEAQRASRRDALRRRRLDAIEGAAAARATLWRPRLPPRTPRASRR